MSRNALIVLAGTLIAFLCSRQGFDPFKLTGKCLKINNWIFFRNLLFIFNVVYLNVGNVGVGLPPVQLPPFSTTFNNRTYEFSDMASQLGSSIIFMPLVAILESIAITKAFCKYI